jgi:DNA replication factor GINS
MVLSCHRLSYRAIRISLCKQHLLLIKFSNLCLLCLKSSHLESNWLCCFTGSKVFVNLSNHSGSEAYKTSHQGVNMNMNSASNNQDGLKTIKDVYNLLLKEIQVPTLQSIPLDTYQEIAVTLSKLKAQIYEGLEAEVRDRITELVSQTTMLLLERRLQKIMEQQQWKPFRQFSSSLVSLDADYSRLTDEEKYILDAEQDSTKRKGYVLMAALGGRSKILESISSKVRSKQILVRFLEPTEQFIGIDMNKYGPFHKEDVAKLPLENARSLIGSGEAVEINLI